MFARLQNLSDENYKDFLIKYNENQSNWLNTRLTVLSIVFGLLGLIVPICFMKLYQDKKDEIDKLIEKTEKQKQEMEKIIEDTKKAKTKNAITGNGSKQQV